MRKFYRRTDDAVAFPADKGFALRIIIAVVASTGEIVIIRRSMTLACFTVEIGGIKVIISETGTYGGVVLSKSCWNKEEDKVQGEP